MTDRIIIYGTGFFANQIYRYLSLEGKNISAFTVEKDYCTIEKLHDIEVIPFEELELYYLKENISILICVGYNNMNQIREQIFEKVKNKGYKILSYIHPKATVLADRVGMGNIILENASIGIGCIIGEGNIFYNNAVICHDASVNSFNYFSPSSTVLGTAVVKNGCFIGANATIKNGITIDDYSLIGANAFVRKNTCKQSVVVPAESVVLDCNSLSLVNKLM